MQSAPNTPNLVNGFRQPVLSQITPQTNVPVVNPDVNIASVSNPIAPTTPQFKLFGFGLSKKMLYIIIFIILAAALYFFWTWYKNRNKKNIVVEAETEEKANVISDNNSNKSKNEDEESN